MGNRIVIESNKKVHYFRRFALNTMHLFGFNFCDSYRPADSLPCTLFLDQLRTYMYQLLNDQAPVKFVRVLPYPACPLSVLM